MLKSALKYTSKEKSLDFSFAIALTGGIATGKSTVGEILKKRGFSIIDLDFITHELLSLHVKEIKSLFGDEFACKGKVDRKKLGKLVFSDKKAKIKLEDFLHPLIRERTKEEAREKEILKKPYFIDIPLFFEKKASYDIMHSVLVYAPRDLQLKRLMGRSNLTKDEANLRINAQMDIQKKLKLASFVIDNSLDLQHLKKEIDALQIWIKDRYASIKI